MKNILLIDDDDAAHTYHKVMIKLANIKVNTVKSAYSVDEAIAYLHSINEVLSRKKWPDFIFVDLNMPDKTGYHFIEEFEAIKWEYDLPKIYFVSSTKNPLDIEKAAKLKILKGFEAKFLQKDFFESII